MTITTETSVAYGSKGGKKGRGKSKRRGNAAYYKRLARKRWNSPRSPKPKAAKQRNK